MSNEIDPRGVHGDAELWHGGRAILLHDGAHPERLPVEPFHRAGLRVERVAGLRDAMAKCSGLEPQLVFTPLSLGGEPATRLIRHCFARQPAPVVIVIASHDEINAAAEAMREGAFDCLFLPFSPGRLSKTIEAAVKAMPRSSPPAVAAASASAVPARNDEAAESGRVLAASRQMRDLLERTRAFAASRASVMVTGDVGTGKSLFAHELHLASPRSHAPIVSLDAPTLTAGQIDDATGRCAGGTLVIEEVCELDIEVQSRLLAFIEGLRDGPDAPRIVATTRHDPQQAIREGRLRPPLFYRLNVTTLDLPPLRGRGDDISLIARARLTEFARKEGQGVTGISDAALALLSAYDWPGNVRELVNLVWSLVLTHPHPTIGPEALPPEIGAPVRPGAGDLPAAEPDRGPADLVGLSLAEIERRVIEATIRAEGGSVPRAARVLDVSPSTLYRKREGWANKP